MFSYSKASHANLLQTFVYNSILLTSLEFSCKMRHFLCPQHWLFIDFNTIWDCSLYNPLYWFAILCALEKPEYLQMGGQHFKRWSLKPQWSLFIKIKWIENYWPEFWDCTQENRTIAAMSVRTLNFIILTLCLLN